LAKIAIAGALHGAFHDGVDRQPPGDFGERLSGSAVLHHRRAGNDVERSDLREP